MGYHTFTHTVSIALIKAACAHIFYPHYIETELFD